MISQELLEILRCPMDPERKTSFVVAGDRLLCPRCGVKFHIKEGIPVLVADEAELPPGCASLEQLPCQHQEKPLAAPGTP